MATRARTSRGNGPPAVRRIPWPPRLAGVLGAGALALGGLAALSGNPDRAAHASIDVDRLTQEVEHERDRMTAVQLARWIRDQKPGLRIFDLRSAADFASYSIPDAEHVALRDLRSTRVGAAETVVLYSDRDTPAAQGWLFLRAMGLERVYYLRGGIKEWADVIWNPVLGPAATPEEKAAFAAAAPLARYFGGQPRVAGPGETVDPFPTGGPSASDSSANPPPAAAPAARPHWRQSC